LDKIGAWYEGEGRTLFRVWAPLHQKMEIKIVSPIERIVPMMREDNGEYFSAKVEDTTADTTYLYKIEGTLERPDPVSFAQSETVHGPSQVVDHSAHSWNDSNWRNFPLDALIIYELHTGTFTPEGTFESIIDRLDDLLSLGINAIEIMPVAQFPGTRNWGYDGVLPFAVQKSYGGVDGLKKLVDACHAKRIAVILDVVYNHLGPEGNYLRDFGPYFTHKYNTPWGDALNFDDAYCDGVRNYFIQNTLYWFDQFHIDALRLDAVHAISDLSAYPFLRELAESVENFMQKTGQRHYLIAESDLNDTRIIRPSELGGFGLDAQWCDDFHHSVHALLTGENDGYYLDFGETEQLVRSIREGYAYGHRYSSFRKCRYGNNSSDRPAHQFVVCAQNHDQVGNRMLGDRISTLVSFEAQKVAACTVLLSPYVPLLFMGQEYGEERPFLYFVSHSDPNLVEAVRKGRHEEFSFDPQGEPPDPQSVETFKKSILDWDSRTSGKHLVLLRFYKTLIGYRNEKAALAHLCRRHVEVVELPVEKTIMIRRWDTEQRNQIFILFNFNCDNKQIHIPAPQGKWQKILDSSGTEWNGPGAIMPDEIETREQVTMRGLGTVMYELI